MFVVSALCFFFSALTDNSIGPIIATMAVIIVSILIITLPFELFQAIRPFLFVNYFDAWQMVFDDPIPWGAIRTNVAILAGFMAAFFLIDAGLLFAKGHSLIDEINPDIRHSRTFWRRHSFCRRRRCPPRSGPRSGQDPIPGRSLQN